MDDARQICSGPLYEVSFNFGGTFVFLNSINRILILCFVSSGSSSVDPWGHWYVSSATIYSSYANTGSGDYDFAVLTMGSSSGFGSTPIGNYMGTLGVKSQPCSYDENAMRITGYPGDKPSGSMWTTGICDDWSYSCGSDKIYHKCDTAGGMSGSAIRDGGNYIVAVHTNGGSTWNSGKAITPSVLGSIQAWAGL